MGVGSSEAQQTTARGLRGGRSVDTGAACGLINVVSMLFSLRPVAPPARRAAPFLRAWPAARLTVRAGRSALALGPREPVRVEPTGYGKQWLLVLSVRASDGRNHMRPEAKYHVFWELKKVR